MTRVTRKERSAQMLFIALELSSTVWVAAATDRNGAKMLWAKIDAGSVDELEGFALKAKAKFGMPATAPVRTCYEAGRDGFWVHRALAARGIENLVLDAASIEMPRRQRRVKTDRVDAEKLLRLLMRLDTGERAARVVVVPSVEDEDRRHVTREREKLVVACTTMKNRITGLLASQGVKASSALNVKQLEALRLWNGAALPDFLVRRLRRALEQRDFIQAQILSVQRELREDFKDRVAAEEAAVDDDEVPVDNSVMLRQLKGIGEQGSEVLCRELFWRNFENRRQLAGYTGLVSVPHLSGGGGREGEISKAGNKRVRALLVEQAWAWVRHQPESALTQWFLTRFGKGKRNRRIGIVAVARRLVIALWRYLKDGVVPAGATMRPV
jgi:transposase